MINTILSALMRNFVSSSLLFVLLSTIVIIFLVNERVQVKYSYTISTLTILLLLLAFWFKIQKSGAKIYSYIIPLSHLIIVFLSGLLLFNSIKRYQTSYSKVELRLLVFYLFNYLVWFILFLQDIFTIGVSNVSSIEILPYLGWSLLALSMAAAISVYYIGKAIFFIEYKWENIIEGGMLILYGFLMGITLFDVQNSLVINSETFHQQTFYFPDLFSSYGFIILAFLFVPYLVVAIKARSAIKLMRQSTNNGGMIDPVAIPRLRLTELSMYVYIIGAGFAIGFTILPGFVQGFTLPFGLNTILSVPFIAIVDFMLFLAFQTPNRLKNYWRKQSLSQE